MYGLIVGYELPRMASRFKSHEFPENGYPDIPLSPMAPLQESGLMQLQQRFGLLP